jgi:hypothetical protein
MNSPQRNIVKYMWYKARHLPKGYMDKEIERDILSWPEKWAEMVIRCLLINLPILLAYKKDFIISKEVRAPLSVKACPYCIKNEVTHRLSFNSCQDCFYGKEKGICHDLHGSTYTNIVTEIELNNKPKYNNFSFDYAINLLKEGIKL